MTLGENMFTDLRCFTIYNRYMTKRIPMQYDIQVANLHPNDNHYVPPMAWEEVEIARRTQLVPGSLILEAQYDGTRITQDVVKILHEQDSDVYNDFLRRMGGVLLNTSWYNYGRIEDDTSLARQDNVGRRALTLPKHAVVEKNGTITYETQKGNDEIVQTQLAQAAFLGSELERAHKSNFYAKKSRTQRKYGRTIGELGFLFAANDLIGNRDDPLTVQTNVRNAGIQAVEVSRETHDGAYLTLAQFADPHSQLSTYFARSKDVPSLAKKFIMLVSDQVKDERSIRNDT